MHIFVNIDRIRIQGYKIDQLACSQVNREDQYLPKERAISPCTPWMLNLLPGCSIGYLPLTILPALPDAISRTFSVCVLQWTQISSQLLARRYCMMSAGSIVMIPITTFSIGRDDKASRAVSFAKAFCIIHVIFSLSMRY